MPRRKKEEEAAVSTEVTPQDVPAPVTEPPAAPPPVESSAPPEPPAVVPAPVSGGPSQEERRAAAVAHGGILLNLVTGVGGPVLALIIWLLYERKSAYASEQALQALVFQTIAMLLTLVFGAIAVVLWLITAALMPVGLCLVPFSLGFSTITAALIVGSLIYGCVGALAVLDGREFRYRWVADWIHPLGRP